MSRFEIARSAFAECFRNGPLWLIQFLANPILFALFTAWLLIPVASNLHVVLNFFVVFGLLAAALTLHAGTLNYFSDSGLQSNSITPVWPSFPRALRHLVPIAICLAVFCLLWLLTDNLEALRAAFPAYVRSMLPVFLRRHITLPALDTLFSCFLFFIRWIFFPALVLPFLAQAASLGFGGFGRRGFIAWKHAVLSLAYWLLLLLAALLGVLLTQALLSAKPDFRTSTFHSEAISLAARLFFAYLFGLFAWMLTCSLVGRYAADARGSSDVPGNPGV